VLSIGSFMLMMGIVITMVQTHAYAVPFYFLHILPIYGFIINIVAMFKRNSQPRTSTRGRLDRRVSIVLQHLVHDVVHFVHHLLLHFDFFATHLEKKLKDSTFS
jgi:hypothetical protein